MARIVGAVVSALAVLFMISAPTAQADPVSARDKVTDAIVAMKVIFNAQMYIPGTGSTPGAWTKVVETRYICEGYFVDDTASIATTSGCVDTSDSTLRRSIIEDLNDELGWSDKDVESFIDRANDQKWSVRASATDPSSRYTLDLTVRQTTGDNRAIPSWTKATVVKFDDRVSGGSQNALIKLDQPRSGLPFLRLAQNAPAIGDVTAVYGFPEDAKTTSEPTPAPILQEGTVAARPVSAAGTTLTQVSNKLLSGSLGAPLINADNEVVGTVNNYQGTTSSDSTENTASDTPGLRNFLTVNGVNLAAPASDDESGSMILWVIVAIVVVVLLAVAAVVIAVLLRARKRSKPAQFAAPGYVSPQHTTPMTTGSDQWTVAPQYPSGPQQTSQPQQYWDPQQHSSAEQPSEGNYNPTALAPSWPPVTPGNPADTNRGGLPFADPPEQNK